MNSPISFGAQPGGWPWRMLTSMRICLGPGTTVEALLVTVERVVDVVGAVHEQDRHAAARQQAGGIVGVDPLLATVAELVDRRLLHRFAFKQKAAAIHGHGRLEAIVERGHQAGGVAAPTDARHGRAVGVHFGHAAQQRVRPDHRGGGVERPVVAGVAADGVELLRVSLIGAAVGQPFARLASPPDSARVRRSSDRRPERFG